MEPNGCAVSEGRSAIARRVEALHELDHHAFARGRIEERYAHRVAFAGHRVEELHARGAQARNLGIRRVDAYADVVKARPTVRHVPKHRVLDGSLDELEIDDAAAHARNPHAVLGLGLDRRSLEAERVAVEVERAIEVFDPNADVVEHYGHGCPLTHI